MQAPMMSASNGQSRQRRDRTVVVLNMLTMIHPIAMTPGPPVFRPYAKRLETSQMRGPNQAM